MVTKFSFFSCFYKFVKVSSLCKCSSVNSSKHFVLFVTSPVSTWRTSFVSNLKCLNWLSAHKVRTCTKVSKVTLLVERNNSIFRKVFNKLYLVRFVLFFHKLDSFFSRKFISFNRKIFFNNLLHFFFDVSKFFICKRLSVKIIVETFISCWSNSELSFWI